ncbi:MAG: thioredoxin domain-containing protein, partial [Phycisphaerae bacterium]
MQQETHQRFDVRPRTRGASASCRSLFLLFIEWGASATRRCRSAKKNIIRRLMILGIPILSLISGTTIKADQNEKNTTPRSTQTKTTPASHSQTAPHEPWIDAPCSADARPEDAPDEAVARVNKQWIFLFEVDDLIIEELLQIDEALADTRVREMYLQINRMLLNQEARRLHIEVNHLLKQEVVDKTPDPDEKDIRLYYDEHAAEYGPDYPKVRGKIQARLRLEREGVRARQFADDLRKAAVLSSVSQESIRSGLPSDPNKVLARVNEEFITVADIERGIRPLVGQAQGQTHTLRTNALEQFVNDLLLKEQAKREHVPEEELLSREIKKRMNEVTEADARRFYALNRKRIQTDINTPEGLRSVMHYLKEKELQRATLAFSEALRNEAEITLFLPSPENPVFEIDTRDQPALGPDDAPITLIAFLDFQCSACAWLHDHMAVLMKKHKGKVRFVARDFPLKGHKNAYRAAHAAEAARADRVDVDYWSC